MLLCHLESVVATMLLLITVITHIQQWLLFRQWLACKLVWLRNINVKVGYNLYC